jgi:perosamine synthetase
MSDLEMKDKLAIFGGAKSIGGEFIKYNSMGEEEVIAACDVVRSGTLSSFLGAWHDDFYGGPKVRQFERDCEAYFNVKHAITFNSWTSGLIAAIGAIGISPGDEVIVPTWTMCASATAIIHWNGIPIFADIEPETFNIDPESVRKNISNKTKAILAVDIFGHSADIETLAEIAAEHGLMLISDSAQAPAAKVHGKHAGTLADLGGFSLNYHKHINTGEGGILVTNDDRLAERSRLIRNHAEAVVGPKGEKDLANMIGYNFRLGEIEAAIGIEQLRKLDNLVSKRQAQAAFLSDNLKNLKGLKTPKIRDGYTHAFYIYGLTLDINALGVSRQKIADALAAEGLSLITEYQNIHLLPMFQQKIAYGNDGFPWTLRESRKNINYQKGICPVAEELNDHKFLGLVLCLYDFQSTDLEAIVNAFQKVWANLEVLRKTS